MSYVLTPNLSLKKIDYNTEEDSWGGLENGNSDIIDSAVGNKHTFMVNKGDIGQSIPTATIELVTWNTELFDSNSDFSGNRFTPSETGFYFLHAQITFSNLDAGVYCSIYIYQDGVELHRYQLIVPDVTTDPNTLAISTTAQVAAIGRYFEVFAVHLDQANENISGGPLWTFFTGFKI